MEIWAAVNETGASWLAVLSSSTNAFAWTASAIDDERSLLTLLVRCAITQIYTKRTKQQPDLNMTSASCFEVRRRRHGLLKPQQNN